MTRFFAAFKELLRTEPNGKVDYANLLLLIREIVPILEAIKTPILIAVKNRKRPVIEDPLLFIQDILIPLIRKHNMGDELDRVFSVGRPADEAKITQEFRYP
jgi:hypothetical protein